MGLTIESIRTGDEAQRHELRRQAFDHRRPFDPDSPGLPADRVVCAYEGDRMVGAVVALPFEMAFGGALLPCAGVSGVVVAPEARGRGAARAMLEESLRRMVERGETIAGLYPTTATLYRSVGFEVAGRWTRRALPLDALPRGHDDLDWRRVEFDDPAIRACAQALTPHWDGWYRQDDLMWDGFAHRLRVDAESANVFAYVGDRAGRPAAALVYRYESPEGSSTAMYDLSVDLLGAVDGAAVASALGFLAGHGTTVGEVRTTVPEQFLGPYLDHAQRSRVLQDWPWMLRLVDVQAAVAARPVPASVTGTVHLDVSDPSLPANAGAWVLEVGDGRATLTRGGRGTVRLAAGDLAAVFAGAEVRALAGVGRLAGASAEDVDLLRAAFVGTPTCPFFY